MPRLPNKEWSVSLAKISCRHYTVGVNQGESNLFDLAAFRDLQSGRRRDAAAGAMRRALAVVEWFYAAGVRWRNRRYDCGKARVHCVGAPVVSVGNLTLGGTGKTPAVGWLARWFASRGVRVAVVSRGYGARAGRPNAEALELNRLLPGVPHLQNPDRVAAAQEAIARFDAQVILLDDAFQHRRIHRDLDIVLLDALSPFGFGRVFPRGMLRESVEGLSRADVVVLCRADLVATADREEIWRVVRRHNAKAICAEAAHLPRRLASVSGREESLDALRGLPAAAFCGIGNPEGFRRTLDALGCRVVGFRELPDHYDYGPADLRALSDWVARLGAGVALCTGKDLAKLSAERLGDCPLWAVDIELQFLTGQEALESKLLEILHRSDRA